MSKLADKVLSALKESFPRNVILKEHYVRYKGTRLFFDFYIKDLGVLVEVQGIQHVELVGHFHKDKHAFYAQKQRDRMKVEYALNDEDVCLIRFYYNEKITSDLVTKKVFNAIDEGFYE